MYNFVAKHKKTAVALLGFMLLASFFGLKFIKYNNNIESMLPQDSQVQQSMRFLRESNFSDKLVISLRLTDQKHTSDNLIFEADKLAASLNSPLIRQVISSVSGANLMQEAIFFLQFCPQLINADSLPELNAKLTPDKIKERLSSIYRQSLSPGSAFTIPFMRADPLNLYSGILSDIQKLSQASGYNVTLNNGHLISQDGSSTMIIVKTSVLLTEGFGSRKIVSYLQEKLKQLPAYIRADIIAGHMHTVKNEEIIKNDIRLTTTIAAIGFILLFLFIFRDWRALIIFLMPLGAVLITTAVTFQIFKELSYFVIGLSTVIAGITIDYGIYVYMAVRKSGNSSATINKIRKPMLFGALTTISIFIVFFFSSVRGYHQLAFFSNFAIILCLIFVQFFLPHFIKQEPFLSAKAQEKPAGKINFRISDRLLFLTWIILMIIALGLSSRVKFNNDINQFDGAGREVERSENEFHKTWGSKELPAVFVISAANLEEAYNLNHQVYSQAIMAIGKDNFNSFASIWPGMIRRKENLEAWNKFWDRQKIGQLKNTLAEYGQEFGFSSDAFYPFIQQLENPVNQASQEPSGLFFFNQLKDQFVLNKGADYQIISFFPDTDEYIAKLSPIKDKYPGSLLVSRKNFSRQVSHALGSEFIYLAILAILLTLGLTGFLLRNLRLTVIALIPVITGLLLIGAVTRLSGLALNIPALIAAMVVIGIVSDYGIFMVYYCKYKYRTATVAATSLAAITTLIGAGVLIFAVHPVLFSIGVTLTTGVLSGYLSSILIIPSVYRLWKDKLDAQL